ncbi:unnamed protein product, partial [Meganyctiphanes norvegica]
ICFANGKTENLDCPCHLGPAIEAWPGRGEGNYRWDCRDRWVPSVPTDCWKINNNVTQIDLFNHHMTTIHAGDFDGLWNLRSLNIYWGWLTTVEDGAFVNLTKLEHLDLGYAYLQEVPVEVSRLPSLKILGLEYNNITAVPAELLKPLVNLEELFFVQNHLKSIPSLSFLDKLNYLDLEANDIQCLPLDLVGNLKRPYWLWINDNPLSDIAAMTLLPLPEGSEIRTNGSVTIWAQDEAEQMALFSHHWKVYNKELIVLDITTMTKLCDEHPTEDSTDECHPCNMFV